MVLGITGAAVLATIAAFATFGPFWNSQPHREPQADPAKSSSQPAGKAETASEKLKAESFDVVRRLMADFPQSSGAVCLMGNLHDYYGESDQAVKWWLECLRKDPRRVDVYHGLGRIALRKGQYDKAAELWGKARQINPNLPGVHGRYAEALMELGRLDEALEALHKEIEISRSPSVVYILLGKVHLQRKDYDKAITAYEQAMKIEPDDPGACYGLATAYARSGQNDKARQYTEEFQRLRDKADQTAAKRGRASEKPIQAAGILAQTLSDAGGLYFQNLRFDKAEQYWLRASRLAPQHIPCRKQLADLYRDTHRTQKALEVCEQLRKIAPKNAPYHLMAAALLADLKHFDAAEQAAKQALTLAPKLTWAYRTLIRVLLLRNEKLVEADQLAQKVVELEPTQRHYSLLGEVRYRNKDIPGAVSAMKKASELAPGNAKVQRAYLRMKERL
jgi:tetratricopeptide (TPR) repeat protein